jgi:membrane-associated phospholipid phosphatase
MVIKNIIELIILIIIIILPFIVKKSINKIKYYVSILFLLFIIEIIKIILMYLLPNNKFIKRPSNLCGLNGGIPSGHTSITAYALTILFIIYPNIFIGTICIFLILLMGYSRYINICHSILQIFVGACIGILYGFYIFKYLLI